MARHVFDNHMVAHVWAQQLPESIESGRNGKGTLNFEGATLYSYREPIARIVRDAKGERVVLFTNQKWSKTTSAHGSRAWRAWHGNGKSFAVPCVIMRDAADHASNLEALVQEYQETLASLRRRAHWQAGDENAAGYIGKVARDYAVTFGLALPTFDMDDDAAALVAFHVAREAKRNTPQAIAKRARDKATRDARKAAKEAAAREAARLEAERRAEEIRAQVTAWRAGKGSIEGIYIWEGVG